MYFAFGNVGTHLSFTFIVFQPTWSRWRWVQITCVIDSRGQPTFFRFSMYGSFRFVQSGNPGRTLSLPTQVSTTIFLPCESMISEWIDSFTLPFSSAKCG